MRFATYRKQANIRILVRISTHSRLFTLMPARYLQGETPTVGGGTRAPSWGFRGGSKDSAQENVLRFCCQSAHCHRQRKLAEWWSNSALSIADHNVMRLSLVQLSKFMRVITVNFNAVRLLRCFIGFLRVGVWRDQGGICWRGAPQSPLCQLVRESPAHAHGRHHCYAVTHRHLLYSDHFLCDRTFAVIHC